MSHWDIITSTLEWGKTKSLGIAAAYGPIAVALDDRWINMKHW